MKNNEFFIQWIGKVPNKWRLDRLGSIFIQSNEKNFDRKETTILSLMKDIGVIPYSEKGDIGNKASEEIERYFIVRKNDIVMNSMNVIIGSVGKSSYNGCMSQVYHILRVRNNFENNVDYYNYVFSTRQFQRFLVGYGNGIMEHRMRIPMSNLKPVRLPNPPLSEQEKITDFLDNKTRRIDQLISTIEQSIVRLEKYKTSYTFRLLEDFFIYRDELAKMVGLENQSTLRLDQVCKIVRGNSAFKKDELKDNGKYIALQYGKTYKVDTVDQEFNYYVDEEFYKESQIVNKGDTVLISTSETMEDLGHSCYYHRDDFGLIGGEQILLKPNISKVESKFLYYGSIVFTKSLRKEATGLKVYRFNTEDLKNIFLNLPSLAVQREIIRSLDVLFLNLKVLIKLKEEKIEKLKEYKKSLIYEAVTGKIEVM